MRSGERRNAGPPALNVALVHDWLNQQGGAERVLLQLHRTFPRAPVYTAFYEPTLVDPAFRTLDVRTTWLQRLPGWRTHHQAYMPVYPLAFATSRVRDADVVVSNASAFCKGIRIPRGAVHVCYCLTPPRFVWSTRAYLARESYPAWLPLALHPLMPLLQRWDRASAGRVTHFVAISRAVAARIRRFYGRDATVIYPPVATERFRPGGAPEDFLLVVSRLVPYKRIDLAVRACSQLGLPLRVVGDGRDAANLRRLAGPAVTFLGSLSDDRVSDLMARCRAFIFPGEEDFGIAPVEAQAAGRPVIAYAAGGALDTVVDGETGLLFHEPTVESLAGALRRLDTTRFHADHLVAAAARFSASLFRERLSRFVATAWETRLAGAQARVSS